MAKLTLIRGLPGSGKSTYAKRHYHCLILENDMFLMKDNKYCWSPNNTKDAMLMVKDITKKILNLGSDVVIANTFTQAKYIREYQNIANMFGASFEVIRMINDFGNIHNVPNDILISMKNHFIDWPGEKIIKADQLTDLDIDEVI